MAQNIEYSTTGKPHPYHLVRPSIWPMVVSFAAGFFALMGVFFMHGVEAGGLQIGNAGIFIGIASVCLCAFFWWKDVLYESVTEKVHNQITEIGLRYGMLLFIVSEVMFFFAFFLAFFYSALSPAEALGYVWPPHTIHIVNPFYLPLLMTMILLLSGCTVTWAHQAILEGKNGDAATALGLSTFLGFFFLGFQIYEYSHLNFGFADSVYSSVFYMATGFHGFHVFVGAVFLLVSWIRTALGHFTPEKHFGFEAAAWYWHFVDVVWLFLFIAVYWWGNTIGVDHSAAMGVEAVAAVAGGH